MILQPIIPFAHGLLEKAVTPGDVVVDATMGNGHDTLFFAKLVGENGQVFAFDIQAEALKNTEKRLEENEIPQERVKLIRESHVCIGQSIPQALHSKIKACIFNLGYLPGGDKSICTQGESSIQAVQNLLSILPPGALIVLVLYPGHPEGQVECEQVCAYLATIPPDLAQVVQYQILNNDRRPPFVVAIERRGTV